MRTEVPATTSTVVSRELQIVDGQHASSRVACWDCLPLRRAELEYDCPSTGIITGIDRKDFLTEWPSYVVDCDWPTIL
jgi:hypothetical protein